jgi:hypothetical protein
MMDAFPPRMHCMYFHVAITCYSYYTVFDPTLVYKSLYQDHCTLSFSSVYDESCTRYMNEEVRRNCEDLFESLEQGLVSSSQLHKRTAMKYEHFIRPICSNQVCIGCLRRYPERHLSCGHSLCDTCVATFGIGVPRTESQFKIQCIFNDGGRAEVNLRPQTAGVRLLGIDGGGARGVSPLEFMTELQKLLGNCLLHDLIDLALGTSSGRPLFINHLLSRRI